MAAEGKTSLAQSGAAGGVRVAVGATFTAEPMAQVLSFWMRQVGVPAEVEFAPYHQVYQELLDPQSLLSTNTGGVNVLLVRPEDWQRADTEIDENSEPLDGGSGETRRWEAAKARKHVEDFVAAATESAQRLSTPIVVIWCPASPGATAQDGSQALLSELEAGATERLKEAGVWATNSAELMELYPVGAWHDARTDAMGHMPFTAQGYAALATMAARRVAALKRPGAKVVVADCDNTLWRGVVGEDGPEGIGIDPPYETLQRFLVQQQQAGVLLCLCSKNQEDDVTQVFESRTEMPLKSAHLVAKKVNWNPKSQNIQELADELSLGLDSFIFIDDNPVECAQVSGALPEVLTLCLPGNPDEIPVFLKHIWPLDRHGVTQEDQSRTAMYQQGIERQTMRRESGSFESFITGLNLEITIHPLEPAEQTRASQLTQRTNQFNATTVRRSQQELARFLQDGGEGLSVHVRDRFGDYGFVGVMLFRGDGGVLDVDTLLLSCRVLGRGVEHAMIARLGQIASKRGWSRVDVPLVPTKKNQPALRFLQAVGQDYEQLMSERYVFRFPPSFAAGVAFNPKTASSEQQETGTSSAGQATNVEVGLSETAQRIAGEWRDMQAVLEAVHEQSLQDRPELSADFVPPEPDNDVQLKLVQIWQNVLDVRPIGIEDDFFELGGDSLSAVQLLLEIERGFGRTLSESVLLSATTVRKMAQALAREQVTVSMPTVLELQGRGNLPPFFAVAPADGVGLIYTELARSLGNDQPFYALNRKDLDLQRLSEITIEALAGYYIELIRKMQPTGPYALGGYCNGSYVATEMARQLLAKGQSVGMLAVFDFWYIKKLPAGAPETPAAKEAGRAQWKQTVKRVGSAVKRLIGPGEPSGPSEANPLPRRQSELSFLLQRRVQYREPQTFDGHIHYFGSEERWKLDYPDGWENIALKGVTLHQITGTHRTMLQHPHVKLLAEKLRTAMRQSRVGSGQP